jgi:hypothetical protein
MPYLPNPIPVVAVKIVGYSLSGFVFNRIFRKEVNPLLFGGSRAIAGLVFGLITIPLAVIITPYLWYVGLRVLVWYLALRYFYEPEGYSDKTFRIAVLIGIAISFFLDGLLYLLQLAFPDMMSIPWC